MRTHLLVMFVGFTAMFVACQRDTQTPKPPMVSESFPEPKSSEEREAYQKLATKKKELEDRHETMLADQRKEIEEFCATQPVYKGFRGGPSVSGKSAPAMTEENKKAERELNEIRRNHGKLVTDLNIEIIKFGDVEYFPALLKYAEHCHKVFLADPSHANGGELIQLVDKLYDNGNLDESYLYCTDLIKNGFDSAQLYDLAAASAYCTDHFDEALAYFDKALERKQNLRTLLVTNREDIQTSKDAWEAEKKLREAEAAADDLPRVKLETDVGDIVIELFENEAPETVANYISLVESGYYDNTDFYSIVLTAHFFHGSKDGTDNSNPGYKIYCEADKPNHRFPFRGSLNMYLRGKDTGGSIYTISIRPAPYNYNFVTTFGRVIEGFDVMPKIAKLNLKNPLPGLETTKVKKATVVRKRDHEYKPNKVQ